MEVSSPLPPVLPSTSFFLPIVKFLPLLVFSGKARNFLVHISLVLAFPPRLNGLQRVIQDDALGQRQAGMPRGGCPWGSPRVHPCFSSCSSANFIPRLLTSGVTLMVRKKVTALGSSPEKKRSLSSPYEERREGSDRPSNPSRLFSCESYLHPREMEEEACPWGLPSDDRETNISVLNVTLIKRTLMGSSPHASL